MKTIISCALMLLVAFTTDAQVRRRGAQAREAKLSGQTVDASVVPESVKNAFAATGATATRWEKHQAKGKKTVVRYLAVYTQDGMRARARFREDGTTLSTSKYMRAEQLPVAIKSAAEAKIQGQKIMGGEEFKTKKGEIYYRVFSRGGGSRTVSVFDANGQPITKDKMSDDLKESEGEDEGDGN